MAIPCGLAARSTFDDTFSLHRCDNDFSCELNDTNKINIKRNQIAWSTDKIVRFENIDVQAQRKSGLISDEYLKKFTFYKIDDQGQQQWHNKSLDDITWEDIQWKDMTNEDFIIWMRTAGLPDFRKIWGKIDKADLVSGYYRLVIDNQFDSSLWQGNKSFAISTTNLMGGRNTFLAMCYLVTGVLCLLISIIFFMALVSKNRTNLKNK